eukprot:PhF_6_TR10026/c0_g1_i1/m.15357/K17478/FKBP15, WAFL; FK506-binding protein 15
MSNGILHAVAVTLFEFDSGTGQYRTKGSVGCAILGDISTHSYQLVCYVDQTQYICTARITSNNDTSLQYSAQVSGACYSTFRDDTGKLWSLHFGTEDECVTFAANVAVAMYGAAGQPTHSVMNVDLTGGKKDNPPVNVNDQVRARYSAWLVQRSTNDVPKLGSPLERVTGTDVYQFTVPATNANPTGNDAKGFEGCVVGMLKEGKRYCVVPPTCRRPGGMGGNNAVLCFLVEVVKVKYTQNNTADSFESDRQSSTGRQSVGPGDTAAAFQQFLQFQQMQATGQAPLQITQNPMSMAPAVVQQPMGVQGGYMQQQQPQQPGYGYGQQPMMVTPTPVAPVAVAPQPVPVAPAPAPVIQPALTKEQSDQLEKTNSVVTTLVTMLRDLSDKHEGFVFDFKQAQNKQKPTTLANAQLEHSVKSMIMENDRLKEELHQKDDVLKTFEERNKELQRKLDKFASSATALMDEKKQAVHAQSDMKLEMDRQILKLQDNLTRSNSEREDLQRHLQTVKKLLEISDADLREAKGKVEVNAVQINSLNVKIAALEDQLNEERARRKGLEVRCQQLGDKVRELEDDVRNKELLLEERRRKIETDRQYFTELLDEDRRRAEQEVNELRQEMMRDLQQREKRFQEDKIRSCDDAFLRGREEGKEDGHAEARVEYESRFTEQALDLQRARGENEQLRIQLRTAQENALLESKRLTEQVRAQKDALDLATSQHTTLQLKLDNMKGYVQPQRVTQEREAAFAAIRDVVAKVRYPIPTQHMLQILSDVRTNRVVDLSFDKAPVIMPGQVVEQPLLSAPQIPEDIPKPDVVIHTEENHVNGSAPADEGLNEPPMVESVAEIVEEVQQQRHEASSQPATKQESEDEEQDVKPREPEFSQNQSAPEEVRNSPGAHSDNEEPPQENRHVDPNDNENDNAGEGEGEEEENDERDESGENSTHTTPRTRAAREQIHNVIEDNQTPQEESIAVEVKKASPPPSPKRNVEPEPKHEEVEAHQQVIPKAPSPQPSPRPQPEEIVKAPSPRPRNDSDDEIVKPPVPAVVAPTRRDESDDEIPKPAPAKQPEAVQQQKPASPTPKKSSMFDSSDEEDTGPKKPAAPPKRAAATKAYSSDEDEPPKKPAAVAPKAVRKNSSGSDSDGPSLRPAASATKAAPKVAAKVSKAFDSSDEEESVPRPKPAAKAPAGKFNRLFEDSD